MKSLLMLAANISFFAASPVVFPAFLVYGFLADPKTRKEMTKENMWVLFAREVFL